VAEIGFGLEADAGGLDAAAALDPHRREAADHDLVHLGVTHQRLEGTEPEGALGDARY
jgi:hypothetical protein